MDSIPFYMATLDGEDPCNWAPFGVFLSEMRKITKKNIMKSDFSNKKEFSVSILCRRHDLVNDEALSQTIGCLIDGLYLQPSKRDYIEREFHHFGNRLNATVIEKVGFEIYFVMTADPCEQDFARAMELKSCLVHCGHKEKDIRVDFVKDQVRLTDISKFQLANVAYLRTATDLGPKAP